MPFSLGHITQATVNYFLVDFNTVGAIVHIMTVGLAEPTSLQRGLLRASPVIKGPSLIHLCIHHLALCLGHLQTPTEHLLWAGCGVTGGNDIGPAPVLTELTVWRRWSIDR